MSSEGPPPPEPVPPAPTPPEEVFDLLGEDEAVLDALADDEPLDLSEPVDVDRPVGLDPTVSDEGLTVGGGDPLSKLGDEVLDALRTEDGGAEDLRG